MHKKRIEPYVTYIMSNPSNTIIYVGVTNDLKRRVIEHKQKQDNTCFTAKYNICKLVHFEEYQNLKDAIKREKQLKHWNRQWKNNLVCQFNPEWKELFFNV